MVEMAFLGIHGPGGESLFGSFVCGRVFQDLGQLRLEPPKATRLCEEGVAAVLAALGADRRLVEFLCHPDVAVEGFFHLDVFIAVDPVILGDVGPCQGDFHGGSLRLGFRSLAIVITLEPLEPKLEKTNWHPPA